MTAGIREATIDDVPQLLSLFREFHSFHVAGVPDRLREPATSFDAAAFAESIQAIIGGSDSGLLVAGGASGGLIGCAEVYVRDELETDVRPARRHGHLQSLMVRSGDRRRGTGARLLAASELWVADRGATEMRVDTWEFEGGPLGFYERAGYRTIRRSLAKAL